MPTHPTSACFYFAVLAVALLAGPVDAATVHRGLGPEPDSLHIHQAQGLAAINLLRDIREGLVTFDVNGEPVPGQASPCGPMPAGRTAIPSPRQTSCEPGGARSRRPPPPARRGCCAMSGTRTT
jgi:hypothetical protein